MSINFTCEARWERRCAQRRRQYSVITPECFLGMSYTWFRVVLCSVRSGDNWCGAIEGIHSEGGHDYERKQQKNFVFLSGSPICVESDGPKRPWGSAETDIHRASGAQQCGGERTD